MYLASWSVMAHQCPVDTHWLTNRFLVALPPASDLLFFAKLLFVAAKGGGNHPCWGLRDEQSDLFSPEF
jgi:hypothetical protein